MQLNRLPTYCMALLQNPNKEGDTRSSAALSANGATRGRGDHHANVAVDSEIDVGSEGAEVPGLSLIPLIVSGFAMMNIIHKSRARKNTTRLE